MHWILRSPRPAGRLIALALALAVAACSFAPPADRPPRDTLVIGIDVSGSFRASGNHDDALAFAAHYIYGHLNELGKLEEPKALFVASIGGETPGEPQPFHPIHDFRGKSVAEIEANLKEWFPPNDRFTDYNAFFRRAGELITKRGLTLAPITLVLLSDGVPDVSTFKKAGSDAADDDAPIYSLLDVSDLEYLSRNVTIRLLYPEAPVAVGWERHLPRFRVRLWTVDQVVMEGWHEQVLPDTTAEAQTLLWKWIRDNVDFRVR